MLTENVDVGLTRRGWVLGHRHLAVVEVNPFITFLDVSNVVPYHCTEHGNTCQHNRANYRVITDPTYQHA